MYEIIEIPKKTTAKFFKDLKVGDHVYFTVDLKTTTGASSGTYALYIICHLRNSPLKIRNSQNQFLNNIGRFKLKELNQMDFKNA